MKHNYFKYLLAIIFFIVLAWGLWFIFRPQFGAVKVENVSKEVVTECVLIICQKQY